MPTTDPLTADVERDITLFKRHLNPLVRTLEEAAERGQVAVRYPSGPIFGDEGRRVAQSYMGLWLRPYLPSAWIEYWAATAAFQSAAMRAFTG